MVARLRPRQLVAIDLDDALSISTLQGSSEKRMRGGVDFSNMLTKHVPRPLNGITTENYFEALQTVSASFTSFDATVDAKYGKRLRIIPANVVVPDSLKSSTEAVFFVEKRHTKISKAKKASPLVEVAESMMNRTPRC
ncbi:unnamed protein product [Peronospora destructor]|uniref:Uncharacterized protein n=1 Tax=Peronospora destructor TaxID=86335 RepID=A0AAV0T3K2_9STRA|nr:unnamed protein product [Peronospora destructor]